MQIRRHWFYLIKYIREIKKLVMNYRETGLLTIRDNFSFIRLIMIKLIYFIILGNLNLMKISSLKKGFMQNMQNGKRIKN